MQLVINNRQDVINRVTNGKGFSKDEFSLWRDDIKAARAARKAQLGSMSTAEIISCIANAQEQGFVFSATRMHEGKRTDKWSLDFTRKSEQSEAERLDAQIAKLTAKRNRLVTR